MHNYRFWLLDVGFGAIITPITFDSRILTIYKNLVDPTPQLCYSLVPRSVKLDQGFRHNVGITLDGENEIDQMK